MAQFVRKTDDIVISHSNITCDAGNNIEIALMNYEESPGVEVRVSAEVSSTCTVVAGNVVRNKRIWRLTPNVCGTLRILAVNSAGETLDWFELSVATHSANLQDLRMRVIRLAESLVGSHYLWGAAGASPGQSNGSPGRPGAVFMVQNRFDPANPSVNAASCNVTDYHVCSGRFREVHGTVVPSTDSGLRSFLSSIERVPPTAWRSPNGLWPRKMQGSTVPTQIVWGESCLGVRHFDCVGFINYCLSMVLHQNIQASIAQYIRDTTTVETGQQVLAADILTRGSSHIGFATGDGFAIHASESARGVIKSPIGQWTRIGRRFK